MARGDKRIELKPVDESAEERETVVRLASEETANEPPVRLEVRDVEPDTEGHSRLEIASRGDFDSRSYQPGVEALIETIEPPPVNIDSDWGVNPSQGHETAWGWFVLIAVILGGAVIWSLTRVSESTGQARQIKVETKSALDHEVLEAREAERLVDKIEITTREFFQARDVDTMARLVRQPDRVRPLMEQYYRDYGIKPLRIERTDLLKPLTLNGHANFWMQSVDLENRETKSLLVEIMPAGDVKIDWETLVCYQPVKWDTFVSERPEGSSYDFRVYAEVDTFFSHEFADADVWDCYRLTALDSSETLFGYCRKNKAIAGEMRTHVENSVNHKASLILRLGIPTGLQSRRGVMIEKVLSSRWVYIEPPEPGS